MDILLAAATDPGLGNIIGVFLLLIGLELVLGIDNVLVIAILTGRLPEEMRKKARYTGLAVAMVARLGALALVVLLAKMEDDVFLHFSIRDIIMIAGGLFLLYKATKEIHHVVELKDETGKGHRAAETFGSAITQIVLLDLVFSVDSVITAVGLTDVLWVIVTAVILSFALIMIYANQVGEFILKHPSLKILALAFLITIGVTIFMEGMGKHVEKAYIYLPMGFALTVELLQMRRTYNKRKLAESTAIAKRELGIKDEAAEE